jgi:predicted DNA-binding protein with PD1-like motif
MRAKVLHGEAAGPFQSERTFALIFETGDEAISGLTAFARERSLTACHFTAIGAFSDLTLGFFDWEKRHTNASPCRSRWKCCHWWGILP